MTNISSYPLLLWELLPPEALSDPIPLHYKRLGGLARFVEQHSYQTDRHLVTHIVDNELTPSNLSAVEIQSILYGTDYA